MAASPLNMLCIVVTLVTTAMTRVAEAETRKFKWSVAYKTWAPDCVQSTVIAINGQWPGPTIVANQGDNIEVEIQNMMPTENVVIHWHGIRQIGTPWSDGTASMSQCAILPEESFTYKFVVDRAGTYFYHGHYGLQRTAGLYGSLIVHPAKKDPFKYDDELSIVVNDWWHATSVEQAIGLSSIPFVFVGEPQSLLIEGRGRFNCSLNPRGACNTTNPQCSPHVLPVQQGKTYRLRIASVTSLASLNLAIQGHKMTVVEADGHAVKPFETDNLDIYSGETYSVLIHANQDPKKNYWLTTNVRARLPKTRTGQAILRYSPNNPLPSDDLPTVPAYNDFAYSVNFARKIKSLDGPAPPAKEDRRLVLLNTQNKIDGHIKWAINNISLRPPPTPYLAAIKYRIRNSFSRISPPDVYSPADYDIYSPPNNPNATFGNGVYVFKTGSVVDVILQNANSLNVNNSEVHPWHLHGHDFWILGYGDGVFNASKDVKSFNLVDPPLRNTVALFPYGWTALRYVANNPGVWAFHCHLEAHFFMGMGVMFVEGVESIPPIPLEAMGCGQTKDRFMRKRIPHH